MSQKLGITGITVSVDFQDKSYGAGPGSFMNVSAKTRDDADAIPLESIDEVVDQGLDLYMTAWETLLVGRCSTGTLSPPDFKLAVATAYLRFSKVRSVLQKLKTSSPEELEQLVTQLRMKKEGSK